MDCKYRLIIWDVDGTLLDTSVGLLASVRFLVESEKLSMPDEETLRSFVGPRIQDSLNRVYGLEGAELKRISDAYREHYKQYDLLKALPYDGIYDVLDRFRADGIIQAVATNKRQDLVEKLLAEYKMDGYMQCICGTDTAGKYSKADLVRRCVELCGVKPSEAVMIGDSAYDAEAAAECGVEFAAVLYGFDFSSAEDTNKYKPVTFITKPIELI